MKKILLTSLIAFGVFANAQVNVTASAGTATATYTTLKSAFDAINDGTHQGNINLSITANTTETASAVLNAVTTYSSLNIKPTVAANITGVIASNPLIKIMGSNVTIDGSTTAGGTSKDLTFSNTSPTGSSVFFMGSPAVATPLTNVTVKNSVFVNGTNNSTNFVIANGSTAAGYFNNVTVQNNDIKTGFNGIFVLAATAVANNGNNLLITGNTVDNGIVQNGILLSGVGGTSTVSNNTINNVNSTIGASASPAASFPINIAAGTNNVSVFENKITVKSTAASGVNYVTGINIAPGATNVSTKVYKNTISEASGFLTYVNSSAIYVSGVTPNVAIYSNKISGLKNTNTAGSIQGIVLGSTSTTANTLVYNNVISDILASGGGNAFGMYVFGGAGYKIYNNTVNLNTNNAETGVSAAFMVGTSITTANALDIRNNIFANNKSGGIPLAIYSTTANNSMFGNINYNNYYSAGTYLGYIASTLRTTLADIQEGFGGNLNSLALSPVFVSTTDLHLKTNANQSLDNKGLSLPEVATDFDGVNRSTTPDMGAYEFTYDPGLAVAEINKTNISAYPNPFSDVLKFSDVKGIKSISVNDMTGRQVKSLAPSAEINLSSLNAGLYIVNLQMEDGSVKTFKAIKK